MYASLTSSKTSQIFATHEPRASGEPANVTDLSDEPGSVSDGI